MRFPRRPQQPSGCLCHLLGLRMPTESWHRVAKNCAAETVTAKGVESVDLDLFRVQGFAIELGRLEFRLGVRCVSYDLLLRFKGHVRMLRRGARAGPTRTEARQLAHPGPPGRGSELLLPWIQPYTCLERWPPTTRWLEHA